ncbi:NAD(P)H-dependent oxidoreductase [Nocardioides agariphilus]|jgi:NAD(P)H-dependent FMN reductase|uniref:NAD(P)H-dependent oxidoreductase n=1 Tax=Nocardioides agariphilus TaxID=433664 RepID=A0A930VK58_9ACTN|nr:NAD(P)H-dependent oxidoreductase [Nocardioides agariphilus]MBF4767131.1 NAD(P)H-dependent oxidoreductase [Nocardioides agariphilus]
MEQVRVLLISGSTRPGSSNTRALQALHGRAWPGVTTDLYDGLLDLPAFVPGTEPEPRAVRDLLDRIAAADAVLFSTPEYAGGLPGSLKNLLDWTVGGGQLYEKPVAWLDVANPGRGGGARAQLRTVLGYVGARVLESACVHLTPASDPGDAAAVAAQDAQLVTAMAQTAAAIRKEPT